MRLMRATRTITFPRQCIQKTMKTQKCTLRRKTPHTNKSTYSSPYSRITSNDTKPSGEYEVTAGLSPCGTVFLTERLKDIAASIPKTTIHLATVHKVSDPSESGLRDLAETSSSTYQIKSGGNDMERVLKFRISLDPWHPMSNWTVGQPLPEEKSRGPLWRIQIVAVRVAMARTA